MKNNMMLPIVGILILVCVAALGILLMKEKNIKDTQQGVQQQTAQPTNMPSSEKNTEAVNQTVEHAIALTVTDPADGSQVEAASLTVQGKTVPNADVFVNDTEVKANASGVFSAKITLAEGENPIMVVANDADGNAAEKEITVTYVPAQ